MNAKNVIDKDEMLLPIKEAIERKEERELLETSDHFSVLYHLSKDRENIVSAMTIGQEDRVLEIGAEMGAISGALAARCAHVICLEPREEYGQICAIRHREYNNIRHIAGDLSDAKREGTYDVIVAVGALLRAEEFISTRKASAQSALLSTCYTLLNHGGRFYLAMDNRIGMRRFAGHPGAQSGMPFGEITQRTNATFSCAEMKRCLEDAGFEAPFFYFPYPDHFFSKQIFSEEFSPENTFSYNSAWLDVQAIQMFDEGKAVLNLNGLDEQKILANSFLIEAVKP